MSDSDYDEQYAALLPRFDRVFQSANTISDTGVELLSIVTSNPSTACAEALAASTLNHVEANPQGVDALASAINALGHTIEASSVTISEDDESNPFQDVFSSQLSGFLKDRLHETRLHIPKQTTVTPTNTTLSAALFSAAATKHRLFGSHSATYAFARQGLQLPDATREQERDEVVAIGVCLQLSVAGAAMMEQWLGASDGGDAVFQALKGLKEGRVIASQGGLRLLDKTIIMAEGKYSQAISPAEAWAILFST